MTKQFYEQAVDRFEEAVMYAVDASGVYLAPARHEREEARAALFAQIEALRRPKENDGLEECGMFSATDPEYTYLASGVTSDCAPAQDDVSHIQSDGWIEWKGGECPVSPRDLVYYWLREGGVGAIYGPGVAEGLDWSHGSSGDHWNDIIAYRLVTGEPKP